MESVQPLLLTHSDSDGAGTATRRIHNGLRELGVNSQMWVRENKIDSNSIQGPDSPFSKIISKLRSPLDTLPLGLYRFPNEFTLSWVPDRLHNHVDQIDPDVVHLNWVAGGYMSPKSIPKFNRPIVWRLPDMWPFTGGCHYTKGCTKYRSECGECPQLNSNRSLDPSHITLKQKKQAISRSDTTVVATTSWLASCAKNSSVFQDCNIEIIPNGLNTTVFKPYPKVESRKLFELPQDVPLILFGAVSPLSNPRKGFSLIRDATQAFATMTNVDAELAIFGDRDQSNFSDFPLPMHSMGYITNEERLAKLYSAADIMVVPSKYEGFGQTVTESMASGTPVVAFDTTGPSDIIDHKETGYLAEPYNPKDLATGIEFLLNDDHRLDEYSENARTEAVNEYHYTTVAKQYLNLYRSIV